MSDIRFEPLARFAVALKAAAQAARHRRALILCGRPGWCRDAARAVVGAGELGRVLWIGAEAPQGTWSLPAGQAHRVLGQEVDGIVFDAFGGFDPDAFGACSGAIRGGGLLVLLTPRWDAWPGYDDPEHARIAVHPVAPAAVTGRFLQRLVRVLGETGAPVVEQGAGVPLAPVARQPAPARPVGDGECRTDEQRQAVEAVVRVALGHRRRPLVLSSDRGRGKSAALGIAAARLLRQGVERILVTAPRLDAVEPLFEQAERLLPGANRQRGRLYDAAAAIEFVPPDQLVLSPRDAELLLVDEAAALPGAILERLLRRYARIVFATTVHGYEGTGRGFALRFHRVLDRETPHWKALRLQAPIRWAAADPLERLAFRLLLLDARPAPAARLGGVTPEACHIERLQRDRLARDERTLAELFGLLVLAHYQTRPTDLRHLLDGPNLSVYAMRCGDHVAATALVADEGGFDPELARQVYLGRRRPRGHLMPQTLAVHQGLEQAPRLRGRRVMRIAVHPAARRRGLGARLLGAILQAARRDGLDYVGASFGATPGLMRFWDGSGYLPVRLGINRGTATGEHSVLVMRPLSQAGQALFEAARQRFRTELPHLLCEPLRDLEPGLAALLLGLAGGAAASDLDARDRRDLESFAYGLRGYEVNLLPLWKLACAALANPAAAELLRPEHRQLLVAKVLQKRSWGEVAVLLGLSGRAAVLQSLRAAVQSLLGRWP